MLKISYDPRTNEVSIVSTPQALWSIGERVANGGRLFAGATTPKASEAAKPEPKAAPTHPDALAVTRFIRDWKHVHNNASPTLAQVRQGLRWQCQRVSNAVALAVASNLMRVKRGYRNRNFYDVNTAALGAK